jgi:hypothetical protein
MTFNTMSELSPGAQTVLDAYRSSHLSINNLAAALRAAVAYTQLYKGNDCFSNEVWQCDADELLAIASELETQ